MGEQKQGSDPHRGQLSESEEKHLRLRMKQLLCGSLNGMKIRQSLLEPYICRAVMRVSLKGQQLGAAVLLLSNLRVRATVDCRGMDQGDVREEMMVGNARRGRKARQPWKQGNTAESCIGGGAITIASLSTRQHWQLNNREAGPSNTRCVELQSRTPPRVPLKCLMCQSTD